MDLGLNLAQSNRDLKDPTSRQIFGDTSGLLCKNDPILRHKLVFVFVSLITLIKGYKVQVSGFLCMIQNQFTTWLLSVKCF